MHMHAKLYMHVTSPIGVNSNSRSNSSIYPFNDGVARTVPPSLPSTLTRNAINGLKLNTHGMIACELTVVYDTERSMLQCIDGLCMRSKCIEFACAVVVQHCNVRNHLAHRKVQRNEWDGGLRLHEHSSVAAVSSVPLVVAPWARAWAPFGTRDEIRVDDRIARVCRRWECIYRSATIRVV